MSERLNIRQTLNQPQTLNRLGDRPGNYSIGQDGNPWSNFAAPDFLKPRREVAEVEHNLPESLEAVRTLQNLGVLRPLKDLQLYHGRNGDGSEWSVKEKNNADNATGNRNINKIPALNTGTYDTARDFAISRARRNSENFAHPRPEVHQIISNDPDASIFEPHIDWSKMPPEDKTTATKAIRKTLPGLIEGSPLDFQDRHALEHIKPADFQGFDGTSIIPDYYIDIYAQRFGLSHEASEKICGSLNTRNLLASNPYWAGKIMDSFIDNTGTTEVRFPHGENRTVPLNQEYIANWLKNMHAVGTCVAVHSATLGRSLDNFLLFDQEKVNTAAEYDRRRASVGRYLGHIATELAKNSDDEKTRLAAKSASGERIRRTERLVTTYESDHPKTPVVEAINDAYVKPKDLIARAKEVPAYAKVFESDTGVREGFTLEQHTESVLNVFEDNFADRLPAATLPIMRLSLLVHDLGKPAAVEHNRKNEQKRYNIAYAEHFMNQIGINDKNKQLVTSMIGEGMRHTADWAINHEEGSSERFKTYCRDTLKEYMGTEPTINDLIGFRNMLMVLQTCDSAAYTDMAVTRAKGGAVYRNNPSFNSSFTPEKGFTGKKAHLKTPAALDVNSILF